jgi:hypothetical protein
MQTTTAEGAARMNARPARQPDERSTPRANKTLACRQPRVFVALLVRDGRTPLSYEEAHTRRSPALPHRVAMASQQAWHDAARRGDFDGLRRLLRANPSLALARDAAGRTALHHLAALPSSAGAAEACAALCSSAGANATSLLEAANDNGQSAMHRAVLSGSRDVALALLAAGADPHARTAKERRSPLEVCRDAALRDELEAAAAAARMRRSAAAQTPLAAARQASGACTRSR